MEPSQDLASANEFNGTESGWTTYIGSPIYNDDEQSDDDGNNFKNVGEEKIEGEKNVFYENNNRNVDDGESDDDSMASDASSGPNHLQLVCINSEGSHHRVDNHENEKILSAKRVTKQVKKTKYEVLVSKEEESLLLVDSAASHV